MCGKRWYPGTSQWKGDRRGHWKNWGPFVRLLLRAFMSQSMRQWELRQRRIHSLGKCEVYRRESLKVSWAFLLDD
jgi:hypothetical protein